MLQKLSFTIRALLRRDRWEEDLAEELSAHIAHRADDLERNGLTRIAAERRARIELGSAEHYREETRRSFGLRWFDEFTQDLRYAGRTLRRSPGFTAVAVVSLALGIGANTAVFSILNSLLLRPLPVESSEQLVYLASGRETNSLPNYFDLRDQNSTLSGLLAYRVAPMGLDTPAGPRRVWGYLATGNYFDLLGVHPLLGRFFHAQDDVRAGEAPLAVLSYRGWQGRFGGDPTIVGRTVSINRMPYTVIGVAPREFFGTELIFMPDLWVPMMMQPQIEGHSWLNERATFNCMLVGRLKPGVTVPQAQANLNSIASALSRLYPLVDGGLTIKLVKPGLAGDSLRAATGTFLGAVMALAALVLLAACVNLASLLAARTSDRHFELAIRLSIGAGRFRVMRQLLTEALAISGLGGISGCLLAVWLLRILNQAPPPIDMPLRYDFSPDARVLLFGLAATLLTGLVFGLVPARTAVTADPNPILRGMADGKRHGRRWATRDLLLALQVALCGFLVTASFVSIRGLSHSLDTPVGFVPSGLHVAAFDLGLSQYSRQEGMRFQKRALDAASQLPGVTASAFANSVPLWINQSSTAAFAAEETDLRPQNSTETSHYNVSPGYFATVRTRMIAGRDFTWHDDARSPRVAVVNETFARRVLHTTQAVGRRIRAGGELLEVVGIVEDGKYSSLSERPRPALYRTLLQNYDDSTIVLVRSTLPDAEVAGQLRAMMTTLDSRLPLYALGNVQQLLGLAYFPAQAATLLLTAFGVLAVMLAITGIYGLASYTVSRRVREIGIRVAVGARRFQVLRSVLGRLAVLLSTGAVAGLALGVAATRLLAGIVYQATPRDPVVLGAVAATMLMVAILSAWLPARRAVSIDPIRSLRHD